MAVAFQAVGTAVSATTGTLSVAWPTHLVKDIALLFVTSSGGGTTGTLSTASGFTLINTYTTGSGTAGTQLSVYWARATTTSMANPVVTAGSDFKYGVIATFRGALTSATPIDISGGSVKASASTSATISAVTTTNAGTHVITAISSDVSSASAFVTSYTNANLSGLTKRFDAGTVSGGGGGISFASGDWASTGSTGTTAVVLTSTINAFMTIALIPEPHITSFVNTFEGGTNGTTVTNSNTGGSSGMELISTASNAGTTLTFSNTVARDTLSFRIGFATAAAGYGIWNWVTSIRSVLRFYVYFESSFDSGYMELAFMRAASTNLCKVAINNHNIVLNNSAGTVIATMPIKLQINSWYRIEVAATKGTTTSNGRIELNVYDNDSINSIYSYDSGATVNAGTADNATIRIGSSSGPTDGPGVFYFDDIAVQELASGFIGPSVTGTNYDKSQLLPFFY
jgi:hypothetical protein